MEGRNKRFSAMDTRRSRANLDSKKASPKDRAVKGISLKRGNMDTASDSTDDSSDDLKPNARVLRSKGKRGVKDSDSLLTPKRGIDAKKQSPSSASPPPSKKRRTTDPLYVKEESKEKTPGSPLDEEVKEETVPLVDEEDAKETSDLSDKDDEEEELEEEDNNEDDAQSAEGSSPSKLSSGNVSQANSSSLLSAVTQDLQKSGGSKEESNKADSNAVTVFKSQFPARPATVAKSENTGNTKPITIQVKKVVKGAEDGEIQVLTTYEEHNGDNGSEETGDGPSKTKWLTTTEKIHRTYSGPVKKVNSTTVTKTGGRKYMILDKATIKGMMDKGLIQAIGKPNKEGSQQPVTYKAILPKAGPSILRRIGTSTFRSSDAATSSSCGKSVLQDINPSSQNMVSVKFPSNVISTSTAASTSGSFKAISSTPSKFSATSNVSQVITSPVFVKTQMVSSGSNPGSLNLVTLPPTILNQIQKAGGSFLSTTLNNSAAGNKAIFQNAPTHKNNIVVSTSTVTGSKSSVMTSSNDVEIIDDDDPEYCPSVELSDSSGAEEPPRDDAKYGVPTGVCKVLKSMKMYQYVDKPKDNRAVNPKYVNNNGPKNGNNIRWVAVPNRPGEARSDGGPKLQRCAPPILPLSVPPTEKIALEEKTPEEEIVVRNVRLLPECSDEFFGHYKIKDLRAKQKEQLVYHRKRYSELLQTYNDLASKYDEIKDVGTMKQILTDSKKFMKRDHIQFFKNEMMLRDRSGTGHRYSPKFMTMLMKYYNRSPIGYRFLRQIFTLPAVRTLLNWQSKSLHMRKKKSKNKVKDHLELTVDGTKLPTQANEAQGYEVTKMPFESDSEYDSEIEEQETEQDAGNGNTKANNALSSSAGTDIVIEFAEQ